MPINPTCENAERNFSLGSEPNSKTLYLTLGICAGVSLLGVLLLYASYGRNPLYRLGYGILVTVLPALGTLVFVRLTSRFVSWRGVVLVYLVLFVLCVIIQALGRTIPVYS
jgi:hypothetical protein